jgi:hypothetical protein
MSNEEIESITETSKHTNTEMVHIKASLKTNMTDSDIRILYNRKGVSGVKNMIDPFKIILTGAQERIRREIKRIDNMLEEHSRQSNLTKEHIKMLNKSKHLDEESLKTINEIQEFFKDKQDMVQQPDYGSLETLALEKVRQHNVQPKTFTQERVLELVKVKSKRGGIRKSNKRKNKTKNKKYTRKNQKELFTRK